MVQSYGGHFLHTLLTFILNPEESEAFPISLSLMGKGKFCHFPMSLRLWDPWHGHASVYNTHATQMSLFSPQRGGCLLIWLSSTALCRNSGSDTMTCVMVRIVVSHFNLGSHCVFQ